MSEILSYSFHIGNDKNKTKRAKQKNTPTNYNNNAIQNAMQLSKVNHHNLRQYDNNPEKIKTLYGSNNIVKDVKELYKKEFDESRLEYNNKQVRVDRKIDNYFNKISRDTKHDLAVEIIIELGDINYWSNKNEEEMYKMEDVYKEQVDYLKELVPDFKVANATIHFDESSPHLHIVGIAIKDNCKTGMRKQVGKCSVFTKDNLPKIQDKMREKCIESFNKEYSLNAFLKDKQKGRNIDYRVSQMSDYEILKKNYDKQRQKIDKINKSTEVLNDKSNEVKSIINHLKNQPLSKNNLLLSNENKNKIIDYIEEVNKSNKEIKTITNYSLSVNKIKKDFEYNHEVINNLNKRINEQSEEIKLLKQDLNNKEEVIDEKDNEISFLKSKISDLREIIDYWKNRFNKILSFIHDKIIGRFGNNDKELYKNMATNLYVNRVLEDNEYNILVNNKSKSRDDFER